MSTEREYRVEVIDPTPEAWRGHSACTLGISLGEHYHERGKFRATVRWVCEHFTSCAIVLCDSLQRFNSPRYFQGDSEGALAEAIAEGDGWLARNAGALESFSIPCEVTRWEEWRRHPDFSQIQDNTARLVASDPELRATIERDVTRFISNNPLRVDGVTISSGRRLSAGMSYMIEEVAGLTLFSRQHGFFEVYAGPKISALDYLKRHPTPDTPPEILRLDSVKIDFRKIAAVVGG